MEVKEKNYTPGSMSFAEGFMGPKGDVGFMMVADWSQAKEIIEKLISQGKNIDTVEMGLDGDWSCNSMVIWENGEFTEYNCWNSSRWAEPIIIVNYKDEPSETYSVYEKKQ